MFDHFLHDSEFSPLVDLSTTSALAALPSVHAYHRPMHMHMHPAVPQLSVHPSLHSSLPVAKHHDHDAAHPFETAEMRQVREAYEQLRRKYRDMRVEKMAEAYAAVAQQARQRRSAELEPDQEDHEGSRGAVSSALQRFSLTNTNADGHQRTMSSSRTVSRTQDAKGRATTEEQTAHKELVDGKVVVNRNTHTRKGPDGKIEDLLQGQEAASDKKQKPSPARARSRSRSSSTSATRKASAPTPQPKKSPKPKPTRAASRKASTSKPKGTRKASAAKK